ncbi:MAG: hypothetical protein ACRDFQ_07040, partial [Anaerolineales bacterium]
KSDKKQSPVEEPVEEPEKPAPTAMEIALKKAMEKGEAQDQAVAEPPSTKKDRREMEELLSRTLENRVRSK